MTEVVISGMSSVEHVQPDGSFAVYQPGEPVPPRIGAGDRLRVQLEAADGIWLYAVAELPGKLHTRLGAWPPGEIVRGGVGQLWPGGRVLSADGAAIRTLIVIASSEELAWARDLTTVDGSGMVGKPRPVAPVTACDHVYGLIWKVPPRPRGMVPPVVDQLDDGGVRLPAIVSRNAGAPYTAIEWQFKPRR
jgi:hypothetical protein